MTCFSVIFKGSSFRNFLFVSVRDISLAKELLVYSFKNEFAPTEANSFLEDLILTKKGSKNENKRTASSESVPIPLKCQKQHLVADGGQFVTTKPIIYLPK